jgi:signal transduction histidine kinase
MRGRKSISTRLFYWLLGVGLLVLLGGGQILYLEVRNIIYSSLDHTLESELDIFTGLLHIEEGVLEFEYAETVHGDYIIPRSGHYFQVYIDGEIIAASLSLAGQSLFLKSENLIAEAPALQAKIYQSTGPANEPLRLIERSLNFAGMHARLIVAQTVLDSEKMLARFRLFLLISSFVGILLIAVLGRVISRRSLRPLFEFSRQIDQIEEKNLESRLPEVNQYNEVHHLAEAFNAMLERLKRSFQQREELLSEVSHQLKTPLAVIRSHCDIYLQKKRDPAQYIEALEAIRESADSMGEKIQRLLAIAQTEADLMSAARQEKVPLNPCLQKARTTVEPLAHGPEIEFSESLEPGLLVQGNSERLVEAFANLLENAVKYNKFQGRVEITTKRHKSHAQVTIADTGRGIDPQHATKIFETFYREQTDSQIEGSGLGLTLVKAIIDAHQGKIEVTRRPQGGTSFTVTLPMAPTEPANESETRRFFRTAVRPD